MSRSTLSPTYLNVVLGWFAELEELAATD